jgi:predicted amidophosphoribosyltransferase
MRSLYLAICPRCYRPYETDGVHLMCERCQQELAENERVV